MGQFLGTHVNRLDRKGRVSVPAPFRAALARMEGSELILRPHHKSACIEARPEAEFRRLTARLDALDAFSDEHDALAFALFASAHAAVPDAEGRIVLPEALIAHAGLGETVAFVGLGRLFQLWTPEAAERMTRNSVGVARDRGLTLPAGGAA
ncbi:MAG: cell division/cell wall cluster transcriptional repressor MraZ [Acetobacteraceae bacterium]